MRKHLFLFLLLLSVLLLVGAASAPPQLTAGGPPPYDHALHARVNEKAKKGCVDCHTFDSSKPGSLEVELLAARGSICHGCHAPERGRSWGAPKECRTCHACSGKPTSHTADWARAHGAEARLSGSTCTACHKSTDCIRCHERKDSPGYGPHERGWDKTHAVAASVNPASCGTCHQQQDCARCHASRDGRVR